MGHKPAVAMWYEDWGTGFARRNLDAVAARGEMPLLSWDPCHNGTVGGAPCSDAAIANGLADDYLHSWARDAAAWGKPFYLRFAWEMNGDWTPYSPGQNGNTARDYVAMWRHAHDIFAQEGATNARWVWCPNSDSPLGVPMTTVYPGDAYVDYLGFDAYNWGALEPSWSTWGNARDFFKPPYDTLTGLSSKPIIVCETGSTEVGGDKGAWIRQAFADIPTYFPRITAIVWFDGGGWGVNTSPGSLAAYRDVVTWPAYQGQLP